MLAAKSILGRLGVLQTNTQENSNGRQLLAQPAAQPLQAAVLALPLAGNLNPDSLIPVVVQPRPISSVAYSAPHTGNGQTLADSVAAGLMRGRGGA